MPPLRERREDVRLLVDYFLKKNSRDRKTPTKLISAEALNALQDYSWPGNVRELENVIQRAIVVSKGDVILPVDLTPEIFQPAEIKPRTLQTELPGAAPQPLPAASDLTETARQLFNWARKDSELKIIPAVERELIIQALHETNGNQVQAAKLLGITRATLRKRVEKFQIKQQLSIK
jgi:two-component system nitrogen regulation response regulator GlnG